MQPDLNSIDSTELSQLTHLQVLSSTKQPKLQATSVSINSGPQLESFPSGYDMIRHDMI